MSVYIITDRAAGMAKIGYSASPLRRLAALRTGAAADLRLEALIPGDRTNEAELHGSLAGAKVCREWFKITDAVATLISAFPAHRTPAFTSSVPIPLAQHLAAAGETVAAFAVRVGRPRNTIRKIVYGQRQPSLELAVAISAATGGAVKPEDMVLRSEARAA